MYLHNMVRSKSHYQLACFILRQFSFYDKNCKYILHLKLLLYYGSRGNSKPFIPLLHSVKNSIFNLASNSILYVKSFFTCFYVMIDELSLDMHTLIDLSQLFLIYCLCFPWPYYQGVIHFTLSILHGHIFCYQLHKFSWNKKSFSSFVHKP